ncbi:MAG: hypothetical protein JWM80_6059 [Cyanobacteria bacterium RYN_339]|nr:hypothetical protein [Cyanobacteria bacterium RYN_339]
MLRPWGLMHINPNVIGVGLAILAAAVIVLGSPLLFERDPMAEGVKNEPPVQMITDDGKTSIKH